MFSFEIEMILMTSLIAKQSLGAKSLSLLKRSYFWLKKLRFKIIIQDKKSLRKKKAFKYDF